MRNLSRLETLSARLEDFCRRADAEEALDFAQIVEEVTGRLEGFDETKISPQEKEILENIAKKLTILTTKATQELQALKDEMAGNARHAKGLKAYTRQQYGE